MPKAIIFDFDGVLVDSEAHWPTASAAIFAAFSDRPWTSEDDSRIVGHSVENVHAMMLKDYGLSMTFPEYEEVVWREGRRIYESFAEPMRGVADVLARIRRLGAPMAIASSNDIACINAALKRIGLDGTFAGIASRNDTPGRTKPFPDVYLKAATILRANPADCVAVEDSPAGVAAAKAAGMYCIALVSHHNGNHDLSAADERIGHYDELTDERLAALLA